MQKERIIAFNLNTFMYRPFSVSDMINFGTKAIENNKHIENFRWVIVDEFQDISAGRLRMINALLAQNAKTKLMVVGDDWQSIYRFAGSDVSLVTKFEKIDN